MSLQPCRPPPPVILVHEAPEHAADIEALLNRAFGPGRFAKSSERVRETTEFAPDLSFCALEDGKLVGVIRMWRAQAGGQAIAFLGPVAVEESERRHGLGASLVEAACAAARDAGEPAVVLVGDLPYFSRMGFAVAPGVTLPGPADPQRVLALRFADVSLSGKVGPR